MKRALVTGATGAIGPAICRELARAGLHVIVHGNRRAEAAARLVAEIAAAGGAAEHVAFDVSDADQTAHALERLLGHGAIQVLV
ncbi:MAG: SDR family NAD(P)-dependent oxidoreductase, partial [Burkholderiales bacterium]